MNNRLRVLPSGFTLIEILIAMTIVAVLVLVGMPHLRAAFLNQTIKSAVSDYRISLNYARSEATKRGANVDVVATGSWNGGWQVQVQLDATVLKVVNAYPTLTITGPAGNVTYQRSGRLASAVAGFNVYVAGNDHVTMRCVAISTSGVPQMKIDSDHNVANGCN